MNTNYMYTFLLLSSIFIIQISSFTGLSNKITRKYRQFYLKDKFVPVFDNLHTIDSSKKPCSIPI